MSSFIQSLLRRNRRNIAYSQDFNAGIVSINGADADYTPAIDIDTPVKVEPIKIQQPVVGFGSYLASILPPDIAVACGAFSTSFQQVKNITNIQVEKFAQVVTNIETIVGLDVNGTNVPTNLELRTEGRPLIALGSGPQGTYTASDFFGCMSGLPYNGPLKNIYEKLNEVATPALFNIYRNLYLAVTWEPATVSVQTSNYQVEVSPGDYVTYYHVTGLTITDPGGGYGREGASAPTITISNGGSGTTTIGTNDNDITNFGRVTSISLGSAGTDGTTIPTATVTYPPGTGSFSNSIVQGYIDAANSEINSINTNKKVSCQSLNDSWNATGTQLTIEQRARQNGLKPPLPDERENYLSTFPTSLYTFVDNIADYSKSVEPHMYAQTLENISDLQTAGGQSAVAAMRQQRNQDRLALVGIPLDNNIPNTLPPSQTKILIANGTLPTGTANANIPSGSTISTGETPVVTPIATPVQIDANGNVITTEPIGTYDPETTLYVVELTPIATGKANTPGSFAGSPFTNLVPTELNTWYASNTLFPSTYTVEQAIEEVILCNCDCWQLA